MFPLDAGLESYGMGQRTLMAMLFLIMVSILFPVDSLVFRAILPLSNSKLGTLWAHTADLLGNGLLLYPFALLIILFTSTKGKAGRKGMVFRAVSLFVLAGVLGQVFKFVIGRPRPGTGLSAWDINSFSIANDFHSFPSGHTVTAFSVAFVLCYYLPRYRYLWLGLALFISLGRLVGQSHFLTDIAAGCLIVFWAAGLVFGPSGPRWLVAPSREHRLKADNI